ncbi:MAG: ATP-dependent DNA helicase RecG [Chloroflexota bacterium]|nr:MAG: ATP-dependent DNA helicase RecG [Chloroflexota bacterium]
MPDWRESVENLVKVLRLEQRKGYNDSAVIGGLDRRVRNWQTEIKRLGAPAMLDGELLGSAYRDLSPDQRRQWVERMLERLEEWGTKPAAGVQAPSGVAQRTTSGVVRPGGAASRGAPAPPRPLAREVVAAPATPVKPPRTPSAARSKPVAGVGPDLTAPVWHVPGISKGLAEKFGRLGVQTVRDVLYFFPHRYNDFRSMKTVADLCVDAFETVVVTVWEIGLRPSQRGVRVVEAVVGDHTGNMRVVWFNQPYLVKSLRSGTQLVLSGKVGVYRAQLTLQSPEYEVLESEDLIHTGRLVPVYPLTQGLAGRTVRRLAKWVVDQCAGKLVEFLPRTVRTREGLMELPDAIRQMHFPDSVEALEEARRRLAFDELFIMQLGVARVRQQWRCRDGLAMPAPPGLVDSFTAGLPFALTGAQRRVVDEIVGDMSTSQPMSRLLQGEVGSGKTVVATVALMAAVANGYQAVLLAPTEILAEQHYRTIARLLDWDQNAVLSRFLPRPPIVRLLTGSKKRGEKAEIRRQSSSGEIDVLIGTHAVIQEDVALRQLGLAVIDEQHRFGVMQRTALREKGNNPHILVMTATPIPRTLALTMFGDLDLSVIDEMPPGRQEIKTRWLQAERRQQAYNFIRKQVQEGRQAFVICPLIEESDKIEARAALAEYERLGEQVFPDLSLGLLHGKMRPQEKDEVMQRFARREIDVLVSTSVVEVGIDVPNASVMLIEGADRFGLSQLHQFRGRVGRGEHQSYCLLLADTLSEEGIRRLSIIERTQNGFLLAEEDLKLRGPGEFFGTRQSGLPALRVARMSDVAILESARQEALQLAQEDAELRHPEHRELAGQVELFWNQNQAGIS